MSARFNWVRSVRILTFYATVSHAFWTRLRSAVPFLVGGTFSRPAPFLVRYLFWSLAQCPICNGCYYFEYELSVLGIALRILSLTHPNEMAQRIALAFCLTWNKESTHWNRKGSSCPAILSTRCHHWILSTLLGTFFRRSSIASLRVSRLARMVESICEGQP